MSSRPPARSSSVGALPREKKHFTSRVESAGTISLDVRCACQYYQTDSLLPERINPVGSRPESKLSFTQSHEGHLQESNIDLPGNLVPGKSGIQFDQLSAKSFVLPLENPEIDRISAKSFSGQRSFEKPISRGLGLERQSAFDQISNRGLVVRSISDSNESNIIPPSWQQRELSVERHSRSRELDTISNRSIGLKRISRTPSKTDLYVADINIPGSKPMSKLKVQQIPQLNVIAPTPLVENRLQFSVYDEFHKNKTSFSPDPQEKENYPEGFKPFALQNQDLDLDYIANKNQDQVPLQDKETQNQQKPEQQEMLKQIEQQPQQKEIQQTEQKSECKQEQQQEEQKKEIEQKHLQQLEQQYQQNQLLNQSFQEVSEKEKAIQKHYESEVQKQSGEEQKYLPDSQDHYSPKTQLLKRHHPPEEESPPTLETKVKHTEEKTDIKIEKKTSPTIKKMSIRSSEPIELVPQSALEVIETPQKVIQQKPTPTPMASSVIETFSLKVDEMDQYLPKPASSTKSFVRSQTPVPNEFSQFKTSQSQLFKDSQKHPTEISTFRLSDSGEGSRDLISVPIDISKENLVSHENFENKNFFESSVFSESENVAQSSQGIGFTKRSPSISSSQKTLEQKIMQSNLLRRKQYFNRTQSQDRNSSYKGSTSDLQNTRMMKTVSFDFSGEHKSRINDFENRELSSNLSKEKRDWLDRTYFMRDHEYEPIGQTAENKTKDDSLEKEELKTTVQPTFSLQASEPMEIDREIPVQQIEPAISEEFKDKTDAEEFQNDIENRYFSSLTSTPRTESRTDYIHTSQVDSSALEELPLKAESRKKTLMASAQDRSRKVQANIRSQAMKIRTKLRGIKKSPTSSPKKGRKQFKAPEFSKMKMPEMKFKAPDMSKFKAPEFKKIEFKRPEFTKFNKPDMSKFKMPAKFSSLKLHRSKSLKVEVVSETPITTPESSTKSPKKMFDFNFGTYPRRKQKKTISITKVVTSGDIPTSSETFPSFDSNTIPRNTRDKGPVGSKWTDKFSEVSYGDSESGKYQRYESSEPESLEPRESSLERKIRENLDRVAKEDETFGILQTEEQKQFAEFDEENRAIHEISKIREPEFKQRKPMVHQDSDLVSEEGKEVGWSEKDILRNKILKQTEVVDHQKFHSEEGLSSSATNINAETQSTGSSGAFRQKGVIEEIDDDEFFLRKRGISQDNIEIRNYISSAIREGFESPVNALARIGNLNEFYQSERVDYDYDVPPPRPRRVKRFNNYEISQEFEDNYDDNIPIPPLRKSKKQYSEDSQEVPDLDDIPYFDDEEMFFKRTDAINNLGRFQKSKDSYEDDTEVINQIEPPKAPKRRKKRDHESAEKESILNEFNEPSISNSFISNDDQQAELVVYRTEHEYVIPLAQSEQFTSTPTMSRISRSRSRITDDDRTSHEADSQIFNEDENLKFDLKRSDGYAVVKKEPPPRPPPPVRKKRFATLPITHSRKDSPIPQRPKRNYSTIGPLKPLRRRSLTTKEETKPEALDSIQYEELNIDDENIEHMDSVKNLKSGDIINKMRDRPLPPPPRPPREHKKPKNIDEDIKENQNEKSNVDFQQNKNYEIEKTMDKCIEVEASTQTDPLPEDFVCEEFEITDDMKIIEPRRPKTLEDLLKEEQEAELERAKTLTDEDINLIRGVQRFRESNQRSYSEKSKGSTADHSRTPLSRPTTPSAILIEKRVPTPIPLLDQTIIEASLTVQPVDDEEVVEKIESDQDNFEEKLNQPTSDLESHLEDEEEERLREEELLRRLGLIKQENGEYKPVYTHKKDLTMESNLDQNILSEDEKVDENVFQDEVLSDFDSPPQPPPRKRSSSGLTTADQAEKTSSETPAASTQLMPIFEQSTTPIQSVAPNRLAVTDLEVERLSVNALQAAQITVSQLRGSFISADDLDCKSGNLVVRNLELPPGLIEEIVERVRSCEKSQSQAQTQTTETGDKKLNQTEEPPARPPLPISQPQLFSPEYLQYTIPPPSFYQLQPPTDEDIQPLQPFRRRKHYRKKDSSSEEESFRERRRSSRQSTRSPEPSIGELGGKLLSACGTSVSRTMNQILNYLKATEKEGTPRSNISTAIIILIIAALGILLLGLSGRNIHHHHWDFFNLPGSDGRGK